MFNVYVHFDVRGLPVDILDDDAFLDGIWRQLPDAGVGGHGDVVSITLSQFSLTDQRAIRRQLRRVRLALTNLGWPDAPVSLDGIDREDIRDDIRAITGAIRWMLAP